VANVGGLALRIVNTNGSGFAEGLTLRAGGALGIGNAANINSGYKLVVTGSPTAAPLRLFKEGTSAGEQVELIRLTAPGSTPTTLMDVGSIMAKTNGTTSSMNSYLSIRPINSRGTGFAEGINVFAGGNVGIGVTDTKGYKLAIGGKAVIEEVVVKLAANWPDYVFGISTSETIGAKRLHR
jgi:hypothetical protein